MPTLIVDTEQAALIKAAVEMLTAALVARTERANPGKIITDSLKLQANKLQTVMAELEQPDPPPFSGLEETLRRRAYQLCELIATAKPNQDVNREWKELIALGIAPGFPPQPTTRQQPVA